MGGRKEEAPRMKETRRPLSVIEEMETRDDTSSAEQKLHKEKNILNIFDSGFKEHVSDLAEVKKTATRLNLSTRRPSYNAWRAEYLEKPKNVPRPELVVDTDEKLTSERKERIDKAIDWLRNELQEMRSLDQALARQLLTIRQDIHRLKLRRTSQEHQEMLDDVQSELEELDDLPDVLDLPADCLNDNPLKHLGVTRMNISTRRFSMC